MIDPDEVPEWDDYNESIQYALRCHSGRMETGFSMQIDKNEAELFIQDLNYFLSK